MVEVGPTAALHRDGGAQIDLIGLVAAPEGANPFPMDGSVPSQPFRYAGSTLSRQRTAGESVAVNLEWQPRERMSFRSITAYRQIELYEYQTDVDRTSLSLNALSLNQYLKLPASLTFASLAGYQLLGLPRGMANGPYGAVAKVEPSVRSGVNQTHTQILASRVLGADRCITTI